ncbi:MAG: hydrogenase maturation protease [Terracidiphilus sp.]|nr:hydrogenase maturation protease [Terracidiphilus sp.]
MNLTKARCLVLACGNTLRSDDGVGPWLATWAADRFHAEATLRVVSRQQWTLELAEEIAAAESVLFLDCSTSSSPGSVTLVEVQPTATTQGIDTHHQGAPELLALARDLYNFLPRIAQLLTVGAGSMELGEDFSQPVLDALPHACETLETAVTRLLTTA